MTDVVVVGAGSAGAVIAGRLAARAGRIPKRMYATASSPIDGTIVDPPRWSR